MVPTARRFWLALRMSCPSAAATCGKHRICGRLLTTGHEAAAKNGYQATMVAGTVRKHTTAIAEAVYFGVPSRVSPSLYIYGTLTLPANHPCTSRPR